jgi:hypothetical protein
MNKKLKGILLSITTVFFATAIVATVVKAGSLIPTTTPPGATMYTLDDIWQKITDNDNPTPPDEGDHAFGPSSTPAGTMRTLTDIYNEIPVLDASKILNTYTVMGVTGTVAPAPAELEWQTPDPNQDLNWADANAYCAGLGAGWRLPKLSELMVALSNSWISDGTGQPGGFRVGNYYCSSLENGANSAWGALGDSDGNVGSGSIAKTIPFAVRCVR